MAGESATEVARQRRAKAERLAQQAELFDRGAEGERRTARALEQLPATWRHLHDVRWPGRPFANLDHVVVGPGGIFVVDSKNWSGRIAVERSVLRQDGRARETAVASAADAGIAVAQLLPWPYAGAVSPVLCFSREDAVSGWVRDVMVCSTQNVALMLQTRPEVLTPAQVDAAHELLAKQLRPATASVAVGGATAGRRTSSGRTSSGRGTGAGRRTAGKPARAGSRSRGKQSSGADLLRYLVAIMLLVLLWGNLEVVTTVVPNWFVSNVLDLPAR